jgi:hypothetical protein
MQLMAFPRALGSLIFVKVHRLKFILEPFFGVELRRRLLIKVTRTKSSGLAPCLRDRGCGNVRARGGALGRGAFAERSRRSNVEGVRGRIVLTGEEAESIIEQVDEGDLLIG